MPDQIISERIREVAPNIFRIVLPLPIPDVGSMNSYVIMDEDRNLIIDPGMAHAVCCEIMEKAIEELGLKLERTDFFITHHHLDHFGSLSGFLRAASRAFISRGEAEFIARVASGEVEAEVRAFYELLGFPERDPMSLISQFYGSEYRRKHAWPFIFISDGDVLIRGGYRFTCIVAPGHTIGHSCLHEATAGILISGDAITAGVQFMLDRDNPLADHFQSLEGLGKSEVSLVLPGHGSLFRDHRKRIDNLRDHHQTRLDAAHSVLSEEGQDAYHVAVAMNGLLPDRAPFDAMPLALKFIHTRHTYAYLQYLAINGRIKKELFRDRALFYVPK